MPGMPEQSPIAALRSVASARLMSTLGAERGLPVARCLAGTGITEAMLADPGAEITAQQELLVVGNLLAHLGHGPGPGIEAGRRYHLTSYGIWGFGLVSSPSLRSATELGIRYLDLTFAFARIWLEEEGGEARLCLDAGHLDETVRTFLLERDAAAIAVLQTELLGRALPLRRMTFPHPAPADTAPYRDHFGVLPTFDPSSTGTQVLSAFDAALLDQPLPQADALTRRLCEDQCRQLLEKRRSRTGVAGEVRSLLLQQPEQMPDMEQVAAALSVTSRTLRRRLLGEGTAFRALVDEVRQTLAEEMLRAGGFTVEQVADRLGYAEVASFIHAFRRWTGTTPGAFATRSAGRPRQFVAGV
ncbi:MAG: AraC family transcriptional regulator [Alcanivorax sp.]|nr:AraC family transcriptional regulator [Alcanivorax sp.]